jgi:hypothetical protein
MKSAIRLMLACAVLVAFSSVSARAQENFYRSTLIGSSPGEIIAGINAGGAPWQVTKATTSLSDGGVLKVKLRGLVLVQSGTPDSITQVVAALVCGGSGGAIAATTDAVALSGDGNADIEQTLTVPASCLAPVVIVRVAGVNGTLLPAPAAFIAASGFNSATPQ